MVGKSNIDMLNRKIYNYLRISSKRKKALHHAVQKSLENFELLFLSYISNSLFLVATITTHYITI